MAIGPQSLGGSIQVVPRASPIYCKIFVLVRPSILQTWKGLSTLTVFCLVLIWVQTTSLCMLPLLILVHDCFLAWSRWKYLSRISNLQELYLCRVSDLARLCPLMLGFIVLCSVFLFFFFFQFFFSVFLLDREIVRVWGQVLTSLGTACLDLGYDSYPGGLSGTSQCPGPYLYQGHILFWAVSMVHCVYMGFVYIFNCDQGSFSNKVLF